MPQVDYDALAAQHGGSVGPLVAGNVDLFAQPAVKNPDGSISTVDSLSVNIDGKEVLLPTVTPDGRHLKTAAEAVTEYKKTGRHLGIFSDVPSANAYAEQLHQDYAAGKYSKRPTGVDYDALAAAHGGTSDHFSAPNEKDAAGNAVVRAGSAFLDTINPINQVRGLYQQIRHPIDSANAKLQYEAEHPILSAISNSPIGQFGGVHAGARIGSGDVAGGVGEAAGDIFNAAAPALVPAALAGAKNFVNRPRFVNPNAVELAAVKFGAERGIPIDAGTASGNRFVRSVQGLADHSPIGSVIAERAKAGTNEGLARVGGELADAVHPSPATPESAGAALQGDTRRLVQTFDQQADEAYGKLREIESLNGPAEVASYQGHHVPPTPESGAPLHDLTGKGRIYPDDVYGPNGSQYYGTGVKGMDQPAFKIIQAAKDKPKSLVTVYRTVPSGTQSELNPGDWVTISKDYAINHGTAWLHGDYDIISKKVKASDIYTNGDSILEWGYHPAKGGPPKSVMQVDLAPVKEAIQPLYERLKREADLVPLQGEKARALTAMDRLVNGPNSAPVSVADAALSDLKSMARGAFMPELRTAGQGLAAHTVSKLDAAVRSAVAKAGPEATAALQQGRQATMAKHAVGDVLEALNTEPVKAYRQATAPKDTAIASLRQLSDIAPSAMPQVGRAVLEELLSTATAEGGFSRTKGLQAKWQQLGPETKRILFGDNVSNLDHFFLLAKKLEESPNPSQSALALSSGSQLALAFTHPVTGVPLILGSGALSAILHSPAATRYLTRGMTLAAGPGRFSTAARALAVTNLVTAAREAGVALPMAARQEPPPDASLLPVGPSQ